MQTLPSDILTVISQYLSLKDVLGLTGVNKRIYKSKDRLIQSYINYQTKLWTETSLTLLASIKNSTTSRKNTLLKIIKLTFHYRIFLLKWEEIDEKLKEKLLTWYSVDLHLHQNTVLKILCETCKFIRSVDHGVILGIYHLLDLIYNKQDSDISTFILYCKNYYPLQKYEHVGFEYFPYRYNHPNISYKHPLTDIDSIIYDEKQWTWLFKQDLKHNCGPLGYFKTRQEVIEFYKNRPLRKNLLYNITKRHQK